MTDKTTGSGKFTGRHMAIILVSFFGVVIAVNVTMARLASSTFGGLVVENSYVASQRFNGWLEEARKEAELGWTLETVRAPDDRLIVSLHSAGAAMADATVTAIARHPLGRAPDTPLRFRPIGDGRYESVEPLPAGRWKVHLDIRAHGRALSRIVDQS